MNQDQRMEILKQAREAAIIKIDDWIHKPGRGNCQEIPVWIQAYIDYLITHPRPMYGKVVMMEKINEYLKENNEDNKEVQHMETLNNMTVKEYAYHLLRQLGSIPESTLRNTLLEKYPEACVDCILREIKDEDPWVICIPVENEKYNIKDRVLILLGAWDEKKEEDVKT